MIKLLAIPEVSIENLDFHSFKIIIIVFFQIAANDVSFSLENESNIVPIRTNVPVQDTSIDSNVDELDDLFSQDFQFDKAKDTVAENLEGILMS